MANASTVKTPTVVKTWKTMTGGQKAVFVGKVCIMIASFGFIFGGALVEGMVYKTPGE